MEGGEAGGKHRDGGESIGFLSGHRAGLGQPHKHQDSDREEVLLSAVRDSYMHSAELQKA